MTALPPYVERRTVARRLPEIFPEGTPARTYCIRELAANTVFTMLYIGAIEGSGRYLGPVHVYRMTDEQALLSSDADRRTYASGVLNRSYTAPGNRLYADNTREPIRDETLRDGLIPTGVVVVRDDLPTTSGKPRYALKASFAALFDPDLSEEDFSAAARRFQDEHLSASMRARVAILRAGVATADHELTVRLPNGESRRLTPGPSSVICRAVIEVFAPRFLAQPAVLWLSESGRRVVARDDKLAADVGLRIEADRNLPDLILVDLGPDKPLIVFVEIVATDGAIIERRRQALEDLTTSAGFDPSQTAFVTAYADRESAGFRKTFRGLAWGSFAWFVSEPDEIVHFIKGASRFRLSRLLSS